MLNAQDPRPKTQQNLTMPSLSFPEIVTLLGTFLGSAFTLLKVALNHHRSMSERFVGFLEAALLRQEQANERFEADPGAAGGRRRGASRVASEAEFQPRRAVES